MGLSNSHRAEKPVRAIVVDDSATMRRLLSEILQSHPEIEVIATAADAYQARELIKQHNPDVITLDIEMPKMNGIAFLRNIMRLRPMPVVMVSTLTKAGAPETLEALEIGAVDFVAKAANSGPGLLEQRDEIVEKVLAAARANLDWRAHKAVQPVSPPPAVESVRFDPRFICAVGASTGGVEAIRDLLQQIPANSPPLVITQHIPSMFSASFASRLDRQCEIQVFEAEHNQPIHSGCAYLAPGDKHLRIVRGSGGYVCQLDDSPAVNRHKPSVDVLYRSALAAAGRFVMPVLLTGMGSDGAKAMLAMREAGCITVAQSKETSVVWGMPGSAVAMQAASKVLPLDGIGKFILQTGARLR